MTKRQKIKDWTSRIDRIIADYQRLDAACDAALQAGAMDPSGPLHEAIWRAFQNLLVQIDPHDWISWFIYENGCGEKAMQASAPGLVSQPITTTRQLAELIVAME
jgi:hypothetical protein